jgi:hypothetical protein
MDNSLRLCYLNLLNDFILSKIPNNETSIIKIIDVGNFLILKGSTTLSSPLDVFLITKEFKEKFELPDEVKLNTIDLIEYSINDEEYEFKDIQILSSIRYT